MRKHVAVVLLVLSVFAGAGSNGVLARALGQSNQLTLGQQERRLGPKPTPLWYWRWVDWRLGEGFAKGHRLERSLRPERAPHAIPRWAWRRLHLFVLARAQRGSGTTTPSPGAHDGYAAAIAYSRSRPGFVPVRRVGVGDASELRAALADLQAGDLVVATGSFTVSGETVIAKRLSGPAVLDLAGVSFVYSGGLDYPAVWLDNASNLRIYGGDLSTADTGGSCLSSYGGQDVTWWGFTAHDCGGTGVMVATVTAPAEHDDFQGTVWKVGQNLAWDPHLEKGSGLHCANLDDGGQYAFQDNRFAFYCHDIPTGAAIEYGSRNIAPVHNTIYLKADNLTFVSQTQTGGNAIQFWGVNGQSADIKYLEVDNAQGYGLFDGGMYSGATLSGVTVEYGRATNTNQNPRLAGQNPWDSTHHVVFEDVRPPPRKRG
jgi:hypothetical protein